MMVQFNLNEHNIIFEEEERGVDTGEEGELEIEPVGPILPREDVRNDFITRAEAIGLIESYIRQSEKKVRI